MTISLTTKMTNGQLLFVQTANTLGAKFDQLHMDVINASSKALAFYEWAGTNDIQVRIRGAEDNREGTYFKTDVESSERPYIVIDPRVFTAATDVNASAATNKLRNAANVVLGGVHEIRHGQDHLDGAPIPSVIGYANPSEYANARAGTEAKSTAAEGNVDLDLNRKLFTVDGVTFQGHVLPFARQTKYGQPAQ